MFENSTLTDARRCRNRAVTAEKGEAAEAAALLHVVVIEQFSDTGIVEIFDALEVTDVVIGDKVDGVTLSAETTTSTDSRRKGTKLAN